MSATNQNKIPPPQKRRKKSLSNMEIFQAVPVVVATVIEDHHNIFDALEKFFTTTNFLADQQEFLKLLKKQKEQLPWSIVVKRELECSELVELISLVEPTSNDFQSSTIQPIGTDSPPLPPTVPDLYSPSTAPGPTVPTQQIDDLVVSSEKMKIRTLEATINQLLQQNEALQQEIVQIKTSRLSRQKQLKGEQLKNAILEVILKSDMNIQSIPDSVEREIYSFIIDQISNSAGILSRLKKMCVCAN